MEKYSPQKIEKKWPSSASASAKASADKKAAEGKLGYNPHVIEKKWQDKWEKSGLYKADDSSKKPKFYCLDMFPYPSGEGLHVGHWRGFVLSDVIARYQMLKGKNVLHPMGWDAFGLPAENTAIKNQIHPRLFTQKAIANFRKQLKQIGAMYNWSREINTSEPEYYQWTQWLFLQLYKNKLAYRKKAPVNWCPSCQTVLANEQVVGSKCERCESTVTKKDLTQWFFRITDFAEDLLKDLDELDWPERVKILQRNWIGKSEGALVKFKIDHSNQNIEVFTTRPDTLFGATFMVLAPEHPFIEKLKVQNSNVKIIDEYISKTRQESDIDREANEKEKTGVLTGAYAINPVNNQKIPIWIADYVLANYGTGACMCVPAHDQRDFEFAQKFDLPIIQVISQNDQQQKLKQAYTDEGMMINSDSYNGLKSSEAKKKITQDLAEKNIAKASVNYRLRDWLISRQRYWGAPIPIIYCQKCGEVAVPEKDLPIKLPEDIEFKPHGESPLKLSSKFLNTACPRCGGKAIRETDTMDTFVDSSWYYFRYTDPKNNKEFAGQMKINYWMGAGLPTRSSKSEGGVDFYVGGIEHAVLHLLYGRFISKALHKLKIINFNKNGEPFQKLFNIGMIHLHGAKMSKSKGNIVSPDDLIDKYGTDALRGYELFIGPAELDSQWQALGISGVYRFLEKIWEVFNSKISNKTQKDSQIEQTIKTVTEEIGSLKLNTTISHLMELFNYLKKQKEISESYARKINILLAPFFPHLAEELWKLQGNQESVFKESWPTYDKTLVKASTINLPIQVNGKTRKIIQINPEANQSEAQKLAEKEITQLLKGKAIKKVIFVPCRIINFVIE